MLDDFVLIRVDYRLAHGQVRGTWYQKMSPRRVIILDDESAADSFLMGVMAAGMPKSEVKGYGIEKGVEVFKENQFGSGKKFVIFRDVSDAHKAYNLGFEFLFLNVAQVPAAEDRRKSVQTVCLSDHELDLLSELHDKGVEIYTHQSVNDKKYTWEDIKVSMGR